MASDPPAELSGEVVRLRPTERRHVPALRAFLDEPDVGRWWPQPPADEDFPFDEPGVVVLTIEAGGAVAGLIQFLEELEPDYRHASTSSSAPRSTAAAWARTRCGRSSGTSSSTEATTG